MMSSTSASSARIALYPAILSRRSSSSFLSFSCSSPVSFWSCILRIAWACSTERLNFATRAASAMSTLREALIVAITSSMFARAMRSPSRMCASASAFSSRNLVRLRITSMRWSRYACASCLSDRH